MYDVIIIGSGPAGLTAAIYTTRANLKTLIIAGIKWGGQLMLTSIVENYPGFPDGIYGPDLMINMRKQAEKFGAEIVEKNFLSGDFSRSGGPFKITADEEGYEGKSIIIATGADTKWLSVPGEKEKIGHGVSSCAPCDAAFFREKNVIVVGGGDSAMEEALFLTKFAKSVVIIHRRDGFRASKIMLERVESNPKISFLLNSQVTEILGTDKVTGVKIKSPFSVIPNLFRDLPSNSEMLKQVQHDSQEIITWEMPIDGIFVAIGHIPNTDAFKGIETDNQGYIIVKDRTKTNVGGVFVAGDVHDSHYKQAITAAGYGCAAALEVERWLAS
ncbi:MAG: thioredoxin-disulfide reductase [Candidatus Levybacteria bacterium]|nr:thioredoxin-disulfide reductase [Candidatus Levybacteria bacterium]